MMDYEKHIDNEEYEYTTEELELLRHIPSICCAGDECYYMFFLKDSSEDTVYLKCPDCRAITTCRSWNDKGYEHWYYVCRSCHGSNELSCDCHDVCTTDMCGFCESPPNCGPKPCEQCLEQYGINNYKIEDDGQWVYLNGRTNEKK